MTITPPPPSVIPVIPLKPVSVHHYNTSYNTSLTSRETYTIDSDAITAGTNGILYISVRLITGGDAASLIPYIESPGVPIIRLNTIENQTTDNQILDNAVGSISDEGYSAMYSGIFVVPAGSVWSFKVYASLQTTILNAYDIVYFTI
jgi:hypothetical protein